ncbi:ethanolamine ammonia-lyase subunit EutC [Sinirhodobacter populi]|uniref:Ethanolamine ammonia-lyase small subunit n=1 Tax=Paenirhodobacter populi TaxID=2306993 RepID=A0A443KN32_9RHOB|nr:ethanolamine ammonia-lyase subunit EutC [Sinirhodobacter populi]RWR34223.1 ethanolamine ammonia-lyase subunit EutC [Sinirhodobacter populi]
MSDPLTPNGWQRLRALTPARIALGRAGVSLPTAPHLEFQLSHARARKAVHHPLDVPALERGIAGLGLESIVLDSAAPTRAVYLQRPDLGRKLSEASRQRLAARGAPVACDVAFVVADGLSALAIEANAVGFLGTVVPMLRASGWTVGPVPLVTQARVAIGDEIGAALAASLVVVLIGERPGLSSPDSMGLYLTWAPKPGLTDEARNCISNVRAAGLSHAAAAHKLMFLMNEARRRRLTGVALKDEAETLAGPDTAPHRNFLLGD